ncbi:nitroreductase family protein [Psychromonas ossibalaenae]|uniref:nitroreductase family protein n=1 Tax=Psychromonas ossibalaenae TaxID=444922 RepID=UPI00037E9617|nr:nitroreductase family protein [Psychromonas ossibalaenae]
MLEKLKKAIQKRYSTKIFKAGEDVDQEKLNLLLETLPLAPTSINSQAWHLYLISSPAEKARLAETTWESNQAKYKDSSYLLVFCAKTTFARQDLLEIEQLTASTRDAEINEGRLAMLDNYVGSMSERDKQEWLKRQVYLVFGQFLTTCALIDLDSCPIEGFDTQKMDKLLGLKEKGLTSVVSAVIGSRDTNDFNTLDKAQKVRFPKEKMITEIK